MPTYECILCNYSTKIKTHYKKHLQTEKHKLKSIKELSFKTIKMSQNEPKMSQSAKNMSQNEPKMSQNEPKMSQEKNLVFSPPVKKKEFKCEHCGKEFTTKPNLRRHQLHRCKKLLNPQPIEQENERMKYDLQEKKFLYEQIEKLLEENGKIINNTYNQNNIHQTNNIVIKNYGDEDLSHLTQSVLDNLISSPADMIRNLTTMIHFNKDKPENMNMYIPSRKQKHIKVYRNNKWTYESKALRIPDLIDRNYLILDSHFEDNGGSNRIPDTNNLHYKNYQKLLDQKNTKILKQEQEACEYAILNNSDIVMDQHKLKY